MTHSYLFSQQPNYLPKCLSPIHPIEAYVKLLRLSRPSLHNLLSLLVDGEKYPQTPLPTTLSFPHSFDELSVKTLSFPMVRRAARILDLKNLKKNAYSLNHARSTHVHSGLLPGSAGHNHPYCDDHVSKVSPVKELIHLPSSSSIARVRSMIRWFRTFHLILSVGRKVIIYIKYKIIRIR